MTLARALLVLALLAAGCRSTPPEPVRPEAAVGLVGTSWTVERIDGAAVGVPATLRFDTAVGVSGRASCNLYTAALTLAGERVRIDRPRTSRMACPPPVMEQERRFLKALAAVVRLRRERGRLLLLDDTARARLVLVPSPAAGDRPPVVPLEEAGGTCRGCGEAVAEIR